MKHTNSSRSLKLITIVAALLFGLLPASAAALGSQENPQSPSLGLEAKIPSPAPSKAATIAVPNSGQTFTNIPITVSGLCPNDLLIKIFANNIFVGAAQCANGSYSLKTDLFSGRNDLVARDFDDLDQAGPDSNVVSVTFNDAQFAKTGPRVQLTSSYAKRGADPGQKLDWPLALSGGKGPYAVSADWGDGKAPTLQSVAFPGNITLSHTYDSAGIYNVVIRATDTNGSTAFLQLVGVANGKVTQSASSGGSNNLTTTTKTEVMWWPALVLLPLILIAFWLGRRHELFSIRKQLEQSRNENI